MKPRPLLWRNPNRFSPKLPPPRKNPPAPPGKFPRRHTNPNPPRPPPRPIENGPVQRRLHRNPLAIDAQPLDPGRLKDELTPLLLDLTQ